MFGYGILEACSFLMWNRKGKDPEEGKGRKELKVEEKKL